MRKHGERISFRQTSQEEYWTGFEGLTFSKKSDSIVVSAAHLPEAITLQDQIKFINKQQFELCGRSDDMVDIAGKRGSLLELNKVLLAFPGIDDGIIIFPEKEKGVSRLCAIVSFKKGVNKKDLQHFFRERVDPAFTPRPIFNIDKIPREDNGKLLKSKIDQLYQSLINR